MDKETPEWHATANSQLNSDHPNASVGTVFEWDGARWKKTGSAKGPIWRFQGYVDGGDPNIKVMDVIPSSK